MCVNSITPAKMSGCGLVAKAPYSFSNVECWNAEVRSSQRNPEKYWRQQWWPRGDGFRSPYCGRRSGAALEAVAPEAVAPSIAIEEHESSGVAYVEALERWVAYVEALEVAYVEALEPNCGRRSGALQSAGGCSDSLDAAPEAVAPSIATEEHEAPGVAYVEALEVAEHVDTDLAMAIILSNWQSDQLRIVGFTCWGCGVRTCTTRWLDDERCPHKCCPRHSCLEKLHCHWVEIVAESEAWEQWEERMLMAAHDRIRKKNAHAYAT